MTTHRDEYTDAWKLFPKPAKASKRRVSYVDIKGQPFGLLEPVEYKGPDKKTRSARWLCRCKCQGFIITTREKLRKGRVTSCGCRRKTKRKKKQLKR